MHTRPVTAVWTTRILTGKSLYQPKLIATFANLQLRIGKSCVVTLHQCICPLHDQRWMPVRLKEASSTGSGSGGKASEERGRKLAKAEQGEDVASSDVQVKLPRQKKPKAALTNDKAQKEFYTVLRKNVLWLNQV